jgi:serine O-acetyltransferase
MRRETISGNPASFEALLTSWREDLVANKHILAPGFHVVALYRFGVWSLGQRGLLRWITSKVYTLLHLFVSAFYGAELPRRATIGRRLWLPHPVGVIVSGQARIGDDCMILQNVTIGVVRTGRKRQPPYAATLENGVRVGPGAVIVGGVTIGEGARIGPNAVVMTDVPAGGSAYARATGIAGPLRSPDVSRGSRRAETREGTDTESLDRFISVIRELTRVEEHIDSDTPILSTGIIDSFDVAALLTAVEDQYNVLIEPQEVDVDWFDTPRQMLEKIHERQGS